MSEEETELSFEGVGIAFLELLVLIFFFLGIAVMCDKFLIPAIDILCERLKIPPEAAGATFVAFGSAAPENILNFIGVLRNRVEMSVGTTLGAGIIAFGLVPALCGLASTTPLLIPFAPAARDIIFYVIAQSLMLNFIRDGTMAVYESVILLAVFVVYVLAVYLPLRGKEYQHVSKNAGGSLEGGAQLTETRAQTSHESYHDQIHHIHYQNVPTTEGGEVEHQIHDSVHDSSVLDLYVSRPWTMVLQWMLPDPADKPDLWWLTCLLSLCYVAVVTDISMEICEDMGERLTLSAELTGATILAMGAQIPDVISAVSLVQFGLGECALTSTVGSQVLTISFGIGGPFLLYSGIHGEDAVVDSSDLEKIVFTLLAVIAIYVLALVYHGWKHGSAGISKRTAVVLLAAYVIANMTWAALIVA